jgi:hypothetical protein
MTGSSLTLSRLWRWSEYPATSLSGEAIAFFSDRMAKESSGEIPIDPAYDAPRGKRQAGPEVAAMLDAQAEATEQVPPLRLAALGSGRDDGDFESKGRR